MAHRPQRIADAPTPKAPGTAAEAGIAEARSLPVKPVLSAACALTVVGLVALTWLRDTDEPEPGRPLPPSAAAGERAITVAPVATASVVTLVGTVGPGRTVAAVAPFDGVIRERRAQLGAPVEAGEVLVVMDAGEIEIRLREAQAAFLKSAMAITLLDRWTESPDVVRARRTQEAAEASLLLNERQVAETKRLLDRGIVSRNEYDGLVQQRDIQRNTAASARLDLQAALDRGSADNRRLAELELQNAKARLADLQAQADGSIVRAPVAGIVARPPASGLSGAAPVIIEAGARLTRGQPLFSIADTATLVVTGRVDEIDVNRIRIGQPVSIGGDAFPGDPIPGRIVAISAEADTGPAGGRIPTFEVRAAFSGRIGAQSGPIRIGMSARMRIETAVNPRAIVVPIEAVREPETRPSVQVRDPRSGETLTRSVVLGPTHAQGVEILSGLQPGDIVIEP